MEPYYREDAGVIYNADCLDILPKMPEKCVDLVVTDPPYGTTQNRWDKKIDIGVFWTSINGLASMYIIFAQGMLTAELMTSNCSSWKYNLIWEKNRPTGFLNADRMPLRNHEDILIFYNKPPTYHPQTWKGQPNHPRGNVITAKNQCYGNFDVTYESGRSGNDKLPVSIIKCDREHPPIHPTQKPLTLLSYLIKTYSNSNNFTLDPFLGSGTTAVAAKQLGRKYIGIEIEKKYCDIAVQRLAQEILI